MAVIKHVDIADLQGTIPLVDADGLPSPMFLRFLNTTVRALKAGVNNLIDVQNAVAAANSAAATANAAAAAASTSATTANTAATAATTATAATAKNTALINSWIVPNSVLSSTPTTITIANHTRYYSDGTSIAVTGGTKPATAPGAVDYVSYVDAARAGGVVTFAVSTTQPSQTNDVHVVGAVTVPASGSVSGGFGPDRPGQVLP